MSSIPIQIPVPVVAVSNDESVVRVESTERSLLLLQCFELPGERLSLAMLAQRSRLPKSTILRLTASILRMGFLQRDERGMFSLGPEVRRLGLLTTATVSLEKLMRPVLQDLAYKTQETVALYMRDGNERLCLYRVNSPRPARYHLEEGMRYPLEQPWGAACSIVMAFGPEGETDPHLAEIRERKWAISDGARDPDAAAVAVPLLNRFDEFIGALNVSGLRFRFTTVQFKATRILLQNVAKKLVTELPPLALIEIPRSQN